MIQPRKATIVAEIGCNHQGRLELAKEMITVAKHFCKVNVVKFQKRHPRELLTPEEYDAPHPEPYHSYGRTYGEHREFLEFSIDQHRELKTFCEQTGLTYSTSVWDMTSARQIVSLGPAMIKVPSACNLRFDLLGYLADEFEGELHVALGMTAREEEESIVDFFVKRGRARSLVLYACTSGYPVPFEQVSLLEIQRLKETYGGAVKDIGFSGHHLGIALDSVAYSLGAMYIERHFTLDRTSKGTDHAASLEPDGLRRVVRDIDAVSKALSYKEREILDIELPQRKKLKRTSVAVPLTAPAHVSRSVRPVA
ncbi:MAG TPA: N-acetylneuraminate synthase family protein [Bryobacteraceae bacterium]|jgi:N-acetylneuraminate synthase|nr:N-acetylneuraminate synthase family protein [Bryobacteraceae bacterium]